MTEPAQSDQEQTAEEQQASVNPQLNLSLPDRDTEPPSVGPDDAQGDLPSGTEEATADRQGSDPV